MHRQPRLISPSRRGPCSIERPAQVSTPVQVPVRLRSACRTREGLTGRGFGLARKRQAR